MSRRTDDGIRYPHLWPEWFMPPRPGFDRAAESVELGALPRATACAFYGRRAVDACRPGDDGRYAEADVLEAILRGITWTPGQHHRPERGRRPRRQRVDDEGLTDLIAEIA